MVWIFGGGTGLEGIWPSRSDVAFGEHGLASDRWQLLTIWGLGLMFLSWLMCRIQRVRVDEQGLYVSNYWSEVRIPFHEISHLTERAWFLPRTVTIHLQRNSEFGNRIVFIPRGWVTFGPHPVIEELLKHCQAVRDHPQPRRSRWPGSE